MFLIILHQLFFKVCAITGTKRKKMSQSFKSLNSYCQKRQYLRTDFLPQGYLALANLCDSGVRRCLCASTLATLSPFHPRSMMTLKKGPLFQVQTQPTLISTFQRQRKQKERVKGGWALYKCSTVRTTALLHVHTRTHTCLSLPRVRL